MLLPGRIYAERVLRHFENFRNIFLLNVVKDQKKEVSPSERGDPIVSGVAATWRFWFCSRGDRLQWDGKRRLHSAQSKQKKVKQENDLQRGS